MPSNPTQAPHPLAQQLLSLQPRGPILLAGVGHGRNIYPFVERSYSLVGIDTNRTLIELCKTLFADAANIRLEHISSATLPFTAASFEAVLSTHLLQHGRPAEVRTLLSELTRVALPGASLFVAFASQTDARFGHGTFLETNCYAPQDGDEIGVPHSYFTESEVHAMLQPECEILDLEETNADLFVGTWAHSIRQGIVHWFVHALKR